MLKHHENSVYTRNANKKLEFLVYCIEILKDYYHTSGQKIYYKLKHNNVLSYIYANYEVLHSMGKLYLIENLIKLIEKGD